ncbi:hypothetical protein PLESTF_000167100 [Pleodorina starrii]|nr:hypothetical protein PLESTF_000167100 [Pleodorina starrii]
MSLQAGQLQCTVEFAKGLVDKEWFGKQDPYAILELGGQTYKTKTHRDGGTAPVWNETFVIIVNAETELSVTVKDENWGKDKLLGVASVSLATVRTHGEDRVHAPLWLSNHKQKGFVSLVLRFTPAGAPPPAAAGAAPSPAASTSPAFPQQQPPLQQGAVRPTFLPGYGVFPAPARPEPRDKQRPPSRGVAPGTVFGHPATSTGTPSPYCSHPQPATAQPAGHRCSRPKGARSDGDADAGRSGSAAASPGLQVHGAAGATSSPAAVPSGCPDLRTLRIGGDAGAGGQGAPAGPSGQAVPVATAAGSAQRGAERTTGQAHGSAFVAIRLREGGQKTPPAAAASQAAAGLDRSQGQAAAESPSHAASHALSGPPAGPAPQYPPSDGAPPPPPPPQQQCSQQHEAAQARGLQSPPTAVPQYGADYGAVPQHPPQCGAPAAVYGAPAPYGAPPGAYGQQYVFGVPYGVPGTAPSQGQGPLLAWPPQPSASAPSYPPKGAPVGAAPPPGCGYPPQQPAASPSGQPVAYGGCSGLAGYPPPPGYPSSPYGYPPAGCPASNFPGAPPPGGTYAEEDRLARHALPRFGTGKASPKRR